MSSNGKSSRASKSASLRSGRRSSDTESTGSRPNKSGTPISILSDDDKPLQEIAELAMEEVFSLGFLDLAYTAFAAILAHIFGRNYYAYEDKLIAQQVIAEHLSDGTIAGLMSHNLQQRLMAALKQLALIDLVRGANEEGVSMLKELEVTLYERIQQRSTFLRLVDSSIRDAGDAIPAEFQSRLSFAARTALNDSALFLKRWPRPANPGKTSEWLMPEIRRLNNNHSTGYPTFLPPYDDIIQIGILKDKVIRERSSANALPRGDENFRPSVPVSEPEARPPISRPTPATQFSRLPPAGPLHTSTEARRIWLAAFRMVILNTYGKFPHMRVEQQIKQDIINGRIVRLCQEWLGKNPQISTDQKAYAQAQKDVNQMGVKRELLLSVLYEVSNGICGAPHHAHVGKQLKGALLSMRSHIQRLDPPIIKRATEPPLRLPPNPPVISAQRSARSHAERTLRLKQLSGAALLDELTNITCTEKLTNVLWSHYYRRASGRVTMAEIAEDIQSGSMGQRVYNNCDITIRRVLDQTASYHSLSLNSSQLIKDKLQLMVESRTAIFYQTMKAASRLSERPEASIFAQELQSLRKYLKNVEKAEAERVARPAPLYSTQTTPSPAQPMARDTAVPLRAPVNTATEQYLASLEHPIQHPPAPLAFTYPVHGTIPSSSPGASFDPLSRASLHKPMLSRSAGSTSSGSLPRESLVSSNMATTTAYERILQATTLSIHDYLEDEDVLKLAQLLDKLPVPLRRRLLENTC